ncbi:MAG TPA: SMP-30/gluconolactonase/LRE family protein, partial [Candidatus Krumholzibacteria bacterium]|nr:SMP-30/gluconolactonase/LRE family protein [Candidatus Krumholzibacteria bacterium]
SMHAPVTTTTEIRYRQRTFRPQTIFQALYAPDGTSIVFSAAPTGSTPYLYSLRPEFAEPVKVTDQPLQLLSVSKTGELAVLTHPTWVGHRLCTGTLARMPLAGGAPREILGNVFQAAWSPDGSDLAILRNLEGVFRLEYPIGKVLAQTGAYFSDLRFSPDGKHIAFFVHPAYGDDRGGVAVVDLSGKQTMLADGYWGEEGIAWSPDSRTVYFSAGTGYADFTIYAVTLDRQVRIAAQSAGGLVIHDISPGGQWLASRDDVNVLMRAHTPEMTGERDVSWQEYSQPIAITRDGTSFLFTNSGMSAGTNYQACMRKTDGSPVIVLGEGGGLDLSRDGAWAAAGIFPNRCILYPTGAGEAKELATQSIAQIRDMRFFSDGTHVVVVGGPEKEATRAYLVDITGKDAPRPITKPGVIRAYPGPDGTQLLLQDGDGKYSLMSIDSSYTRVPVPGLTTGDDFASWTDDGRGVVISHTSVPGSLDMVDIRSGARKTVHTLDPGVPGALSIQQVVTTPDARTYVYDVLTYVSRLYTMEGAH